MENQMDEKQSLQLIAQMINTAKNNFGNSSIYFIIWGIAVFTAALLHYLLMVNGVEKNYLPWPIIMTITPIAVGIYSYKAEKKKTSKSYVDKFITNLWIYTGIAIFLALVVVTEVGGFRASYTVVLILTGLGTLITGTVIRFTPLIIGGIFIWICAVTMAWIDFPEALLVMAASVLGGYIIPGLMLRTQRERKTSDGL